MVAPLAIAILCLLAAAGAEALHARRIRRAAHLTFGESPRSPLWTHLAPAARCAGVGAVVFGALVLRTIDPAPGGTAREQQPGERRLLVCLDVSPSMHIEDAGPDEKKVSRARWAGKVFESVLERVDERTRLNLIAFYTSARPVLIDGTDKRVVANIMDGLPLYAAFKPGPTNLGSGIDTACDIARAWPASSATLIVISDGDSEGVISSPHLPSSIADTIVIGVGDAERSTSISGHSSRQDTTSLRLLAARLGGVYHDGNRSPIPASYINHLSMKPANPPSLVGWREYALFSLCSGAAILAGIGPALLVFGRAGRPALARPAQDPIGKSIGEPIGKVVPT